MIYPENHVDIDKPWIVETHDMDKKTLTVRSLCDISETISISFDKSYRWCAPPNYSINRWERFQKKPVAEGVWTSTAEISLQTKLNRIVDAFAAVEPLDYHPGTNNIVRDLVHPSLYPLVIDPKSINTHGKDRWCRRYERSRFQWLPAEVAIDSDGMAKFTSDINNLDTVKYPELKVALEQVFSALVPGFEKVSNFPMISRIVDKLRCCVGVEIRQKRSFQ
jgi:hypothetical protein